MPPMNSLGIFILFGIAWLISDYVSLHFMTFRVALPDENIKTDLETEWQELDEELAELENELERKEAESEPDWLCDSCGERNAHAFETCWKCSSEKTPSAI